MPGKSIHIFHLEGEVGEVVANRYRAAFVEFANFDFLFAFRSFEKYQLRSPWAFGAAGHFQTKHVAIENDGFLEIRDPVACVEEFLYHVGA